MSPLSPKLAAAIKWLDDQSTSIVDTVTRWCDQNSWSSDPANLNAMAAILEKDFAPLGLAAERIVLSPWSSIDECGGEIAHQTGPMLQWHHLPAASRRILLMIHYDTVYPPSPNTNQVTSTADGKLIGPGVADAKGGIAVILYAMQTILQNALAENLGITIVLNPDEEIGSPSSTPILQQLAPQFEFGLLFEPTLPDGALVSNRKGTANFTAIIQGRSAHAGRNLTEGRNAIVHASRLALEVDAWNQIPGIIVNVGKFNGGGPLNQVPAFAMVSFNVRVDTNDAVEEVMAKWRAIEEQYTLDGFHCEVRGQFHSPPKIIVDDASTVDVRNRVTNAMAKAGRMLHWRETGGACDGNKLAAFGLPNIDTMGPTGDNLHSPDEYCEAHTLVSAAQTIVYLIAEAASE